MDLANCTNERLMNILQQSYSFPDGQVEAAKLELVKRGKISELEAEKLLETNKRKEIELINERNEVSDRHAKSDQNWLLFIKIISVFMFLASFAIWHYAGVVSFLFIGISFVLGFGAFFKQRKR